MLNSLIANALGRDGAWRLGRSLYMSSRDEIGNDIATNGEAALIRLAIDDHRRHRPDAPFLAFDIGANLGEWTAELVRVGGMIDWRAELFEPVAGSFAQLSQRFAAEPRVHCNQLAVSSQAGEADMLVVGETSGTNSLNHFPGVDGSTTTVRLTTVDDHLTNIRADRVDLLKIDIEGHDIEVLRSLSTMLAAEKLGIVQFEYNWRWLASKGSLFEVFGLVRDLPYAVARIYPEGPKIFENWNAELDRYFEANYALIHCDVADRLGLKRLRWSASNTPVPA